MNSENAAHGESGRLFFALWPDRELQRRLSALAAQVQQECGGRAMRAQTLHVTLLFLGSVPRAQLARVQQAAACVAARAFTLQLRQLACWPHNHIAYAAPEPPAVVLDGLAGQLRQAMDAAGVAYDRKPFVPHVTLLRNIVHCPEARVIRPLAWRVREYALVESCRDEGGAHYVTLARWPLAS